MIERTTNQFVADVISEIQRAQTKFPSANHATVALMEEVGELAQAKLKVAAGKAHPMRVYEEAIQVAAMAYRAACEHDESFHNTDYVEDDK